MQETFEQILTSLNKWQPGHSITLESLRQAGSNRQYFRFSHDHQSYILTYNPLNIPENEAFLAFTDHFSALKLPVPSIVYVDDAKKLYVQTDLGDRSLFDFITEEGFSDNVKGLFKNTRHTGSVGTQSVLYTAKCHNYAHSTAAVE